MWLLDFDSALASPRRIFNTHYDIFRMVMILLIVSFFPATVDGRNPASPKKPWNSHCPASTNKQWFLMVSKWCEMDFKYPRYYALVCLIFGFVLLLGL